jgi:hypothetical protein
MPGSRQPLPAPLDPQEPVRRVRQAQAGTFGQDGVMVQPGPDPDNYPPIDPSEPVPDDPGELSPDTPETLPPAPVEPMPGPDDPDSVPEPA